MLAARRVGTRRAISSSSASGRLADQHHRAGSVARSRRRSRRSPGPCRARRRSAPPAPARTPPARPMAAIGMVACESFTQRTPARCRERLEPMRHAAEVAHASWRSPRSTHRPGDAASAAARTLASMWRPGSGTSAAGSTGSPSDRARPSSAHRASRLRSASRPYQRQVAGQARAQLAAAGIVRVQHHDARRHAQLGQPRLHRAVRLHASRAGPGDRRRCWCRPRSRRRAGWSAAAARTARAPPSPPAPARRPARSAACRCCRPRRAASRPRPGSRRSARWWWSCPSCRSRPAPGPGSATGRGRPRPAPARRARSAAASASRSHGSVVGKRAEMRRAGDHQLGRGQQALRLGRARRRAPAIGVRPPARPAHRPGRPRIAGHRPSPRRRRRPACGLAATPDRARPSTSTRRPRRSAVEVRGVGAVMVCIGPTDSPVVVARKTLKPSSAASALTIQKRTVIFSSAQPISSKWCCSGAQRKMRRPRSRKRDDLQDHAHDHREEDDADDHQQRQLPAQGGDDGQRRAQAQRPGVAHEDLRRVDVEPQEAHQGADDQGAEDGQVRLRVQPARRIEQRDQQVGHEAEDQDAGRPGRPAHRSGSRRC